jgi:hypothetical protein
MVNMFMCASVGHISYVREIHGQKDELKIRVLDGFMYGIYICTFVGEMLWLNNRYVNGILQMLLYSTVTSYLIFLFDEDLLRYYMSYSPAFIGYVGYALYSDE